MNIVIGIISYLPNDQKIRETRKNKLVSLIHKCNEIFNLSTVIIAQNWNEKDYKDICSIRSDITIIDFGVPLGITGARKELRKVFLSSNADYLIMLDDDCELLGTKAGADNYLKQINDHPGMVGLFKDTLLKLFAISRSVFEQYDYDDGEPVNGEVFEDKLFVNKLRLKCPEKIFQFKRHFELDERSDNAWDPNSTWYHGQYNKTEMGDRTRAILSQWIKK